MPAAKPDDLSVILGLTWWKERTSLSSDLHTDTLACVAPPPNNKHVIKNLSLSCPVAYFCDLEQLLSQFAVSSCLQ